MFINTCLRKTYHGRGDPVDDFRQAMISRQMRWRRAELPEVTENGRQNGKEYEHILPWKERQKNFFPQVRDDLSGYLKENSIQAHTGIHNMLSSWALCANVYWPFRSESGYALLKEFLNQYLDGVIKTINSIELEYQDEDPFLSPQKLLGEGQEAGGTIRPLLIL